MWYEEIITDEDNLYETNYYNLAKANRIGWEHDTAEDTKEAILVHSLWVSYHDDNHKHYIFSTHIEDEYKHAAKKVRLLLYEGRTGILTETDLRLD